MTRIRLNRNERDIVAEVDAVLAPLGLATRVEQGRRHKQVIVEHPAVGRAWTIVSATGGRPDPRCLAYMRTWARRLARQIEENML